MKLIIILVCFILLPLLVIALSTISIKIKKLHISNIDKKHNSYELYFEIYFINKIKIFSIKIDEEKIKKLKIRNKIENIDIVQAKKEMPAFWEIKELIKKLNIQIEKFKLDLEIGIEDVIITSAIVAFISSVLGILFSIAIKEYESKNHSYIVKPIYENKNIIKLDLNCIIKVKVVHIIFIIYVLLKKRRVNKNERTSNRRAYGYSYE